MESTVPIMITKMKIDISILKKLKHNHIVEMKDFNWDSHYIYIVMEYCGGGDLSRLVICKSVVLILSSICVAFS